MRYAVIIILLLITLKLKAQENSSTDKLPVFKQVNHPFMPPITSEYFYFSEDGLMWFSTAQGLTSFDGSEITYYSSLQEANGFLLNRISAIAEDKDHNFYIGTPIGLYFFNRKTGTYNSLTYTFTDNQKQTKIFFFCLLYGNNRIFKRRFSFAGPIYL